MDIYRFIRALSEQEARLVCNSFSARKKEKRIYADSLAFVEEVRNAEEDNINEDLLFKKIWHHFTEQGIRKFKSKFFIEILDILASDDFIEKQDLIEDYERAQLRVRKRMLQFRILYRKINKTHIDVLNHLLIEIIEQAKEYEQYDVLVEAVGFKKYIFAPRLGYDEFVKQNKEIEFYRNCQVSASNASDAYYTIIANQELISGFSPSELKDFIDQKILELETDPCLSSSVTVQYLYKIIKLAQHQKNERHQEAIDTCLDVINLLDNNIAIKRKERYGFIHGNLCKCWVLSGKFKEAAQTARQAQNYFATDSFAYLISKEQEFYACFYGGEYSRCNEIMEMLLGHSKRDMGEIRHDKFIYYNACVDFVMNNFREALKVASLALQITKDKFRWEMGMRFLKIMSLVELGRTEEAFEGLESMRKQFKRYESKDGTPDKWSSRDKEIYLALREYYKIGFGKNCNAKLAAILDKLSEDNTELTWKYYSHEIIPIHSWIKKRLSVNLESPVEKASF